MPTTANQTYTKNRLIPAYPGVPAPTISIKLPASKTLSAGQVLAELIGNNEVQTLTIDATGGTFTGTYGGQTTAAVAYNATAAVLKAALEALSTIGTGNVDVQKLRSRWTITQGASANAGQYKIRVTTNFGTTSADTQTTATIAYNANTATVDAAVEALSNVGTGGAVCAVSSQTTTLVFLTSLGDVLVEVVDSTVNNSGVPISEAVTQTDLGGVYKITFQGALGNTNVAAMTTTATSLTGGAGTATIATLTAGSAGTAGTFDVVDLSASTGLQFPKVILEWDTTTNSDGKVVLENGRTATACSAYIGGPFKTADLTGLTPAVLAARPGARMLEGTIAGGGVVEW